VPRVSRRSSSATAGRACSVRKHPSGGADHPVARDNGDLPSVSSAAVPP
jgi:hypothetical protein